MQAGVAVGIAPSLLDAAATLIPLLAHDLDVHVGHDRIQPVQQAARGQRGPTSSRIASSFFDRPGSQPNPGSWYSDLGKIVSEKREELANVAARQARERLMESGVLLKEVLIGDLVLPAEFERGRVAMVDEVQNTERMDVTLKLKAKEVERVRLEAEAVKARQMKFILEQKEKEIRQKRLEAQAEKETRVQRAQAEATITKIQAGAEAERRKTIADAEAYSIRTTSLAQFENMEREAELVTANPLLIPKTFADRLSENVQVILTPTVGGEAFTDEVVKRAVRGERTPSDAKTRTAAVRQAANKTSRPN